MVLTKVKHVTCGGYISHRGDDTSLLKSYYVALQFPHVLVYLKVPVDYSTLVLYCALRVFTAMRGLER